MLTYHREQLALMECNVMDGFLLRYCDACIFSPPHSASSMRVALLILANENKKNYSCGIRGSNAVLRIIHWICIYWLGCV